MISTSTLQALILQLRSRMKTLIATIEPKFLFKANSTPHQGQKPESDLATFNQDESTTNL